MADTQTRIVLNAVDNTKVAFDSVQGGLGRLSTGAGTLNGALARLSPLIAAATFTAFIKNSIDSADALNDLSDRTGLAVETLAGLELVATQSDTSLEALGKGLNKLSIFMAENSQRAKELGLSAKEPDKAFIELSKTLSQTENVGVRNSIANEVLGKSYQELLPALLQGSEALAEQIRQGQKLNPISGEMADRAAVIKDRFDEIKISSKGAGINIAEFFLPSLDELTKNFVKNAETGGVLLGVLGSIANLSKIVFFGSDEQQRIDKIKELSSFISNQSKQLEDVSSSSNPKILKNLRDKIASAKTEMRELIKLQSEPFNKPLENKTTGVDIDLGTKTKTPEQSIREQIALIQLENRLLEQGFSQED